MTPDRQRQAEDRVTHTKRKGDAENARHEKSAPKYVT